MIKAKRSLSQNFLIDKNICKKIINATKITNKTVLEIGPGQGFLTDFILEKKPKKLIVIEKDIKLSKILKEKYKINKNVEVIEKDILNYELDNYDNLILISNLPYNQSTKIILYLFNYKNNITEMIFMIQKEVSLKFDYNLSNMNKYKFLTKMVSTYYRCFDVSAKVFVPKPKVTSTVVKFVFNNRKINLGKAIKFSNLIFKNIRKKISNNIGINKHTKLLNKRVNELSIEDLLKIYNSFQF